VLDACGVPCDGIVSLWDSSVPLARSSMFSIFGAGWQVDRSRFTGCSSTMPACEALSVFSRRVHGL
jgi:hypothetical protein